MLPALGHGPSLFEMMGATGGGSADADSRPLILDAHATPNTDGAWEELIASTSFDYEGLWVNLTWPDQDSGHHCIIEIAKGAASSEQVIVPDIPILGQSTNRVDGFGFYVPIHVPAGVRLAARIHRSDITAVQVDCQVIGCGVSHRGVPSFHRATHYGLTIPPTSSWHYGKQVDPGGVANTRGTRAEIVASTTNPIRCLYVFTQRSDYSVGNSTDNAGLIEVSVGGSGSEVILIPVLAMQMNSNCDTWSPMVHGPFFVNLDAGERLSAVAQADTTTAEVREFAVSILGFD